MIRSLDLWRFLHIFGLDYILLGHKSKLSLYPKVEINDKICMVQIVFIVDIIKFLVIGTHFTGFISNREICSDITLRKCHPHIGMTSLLVGSGVSFENIFHFSLRTVNRNNVKCFYIIFHITKTTFYRLCRNRRWSTVWYTKGNNTD